MRSPRKTAPRIKVYHVSGENGHAATNGHTNGNGKRNPAEPGKRQLEVIVQQYRAMPDPVAEVAMAQLAAVFVKTFGPVVEDTIVTASEQLNDIALSAFLAALGTVEDAESYEWLRPMLKRLAASKNPVVAVGAEDGLDLLEDARLRRGGSSSSAHRTV